jgi:vitamin-K-epoxide reductase (warfarin-sensitive)
MSSYWRSQLKILLSLSGLVISCYALYVEVSKESDPNFVALCDLSEKSSCSRVLTSSYGTGLGLVRLVLGEDSVLNVSNALYGIIMYSLLALFSLSPILDRTLFPVIVFASTASSLYLLYIMLYVLEDLCVVCMGIHAVNMGLSLLVLYSCWCGREHKIAPKEKKE